MKYKVLEYLKGLLEKKYNNLDDDSGCNIFNSDINEYEWLSVKAIIKLIDQTDEEF